MPIVKVHGGASQLSDAARGAVTANEVLHERFVTRKKLELAERSLASEIDQRQKLFGLEQQQQARLERGQEADIRQGDERIRAAEEENRLERERRAKIDTRNDQAFEQEQQDRAVQVGQEDAERASIVKQMRAMGASRGELEQAAQLPIDRLRMVAKARQVDQHARTTASRTMARAQRMYGQGVFGDPQVQEEGEPGAMPKTGPAEDRMSQIEQDLKAMPEMADQVDRLLNDVEREHYRKQAELAKRSDFIAAEQPRMEPISKSNPQVFADMMLAANLYADGTIDQTQYVDEMNRGYWLDSFNVQRIKEIAGGDRMAALQALQLVEDVENRVLSASDAAKEMRKLQMGIIERETGTAQQAKPQTFEIATGKKDGKPVYTKIDIPPAMQGQGRQLTPDDAAVMQFYAQRATEIMKARGEKTTGEKGLRAVDEFAYQMAQQYGGWR